MSSKEFLQWIAFNKLEPGYPQREDDHTALICHTIGNMLKSKGKPFELSDFYINYEPKNKEKPRQSRKEAMVRMTSFLTTIKAKKIR